MSNLNSQTKTKEIVRKWLNICQKVLFPFNILKKFHKILLIWESTGKVAFTPVSTVMLLIQNQWHLSLPSLFFKLSINELLCCLVITCFHGKREQASAKGVGGIDMTGWIIDSWPERKGGQPDIPVTSGFTPEGASYLKSKQQLSLKRQMLSI